MDLITPGIGLTFWTVIIFGLLLLVLRLVAWKPISKALDDRGKNIDDALKAAEQAREEMKSLKADNEKIFAEARIDRDKILAEARQIKENTINEAKSQAEIEFKSIIERAQQEVKDMKASAIEDIKNQVLDLSIAIAENVIKDELKDLKKQEKLINDLINEINLN